jgi:glycerophosphoryl diester phosphodiesterase
VALLLGHRGSPHEARENTLESFYAALAAGLDGLELDIHRTKDGVLAVCHDFLVAGYAIQHLTWAELQILAPWVPRIEAVFDLADQFPKTKLNLELKSHPEIFDGREQALSEALKSWSGRERCWVSSFDPLALLRLSRLTSVELGLLYYRPEILDLLPSLPVQAVHPHVSLLTQQQVEEFKTQGLAVHTWTVNESSTVKKLQNWGVDGIIGDFPQILLAK